MSTASGKVSETTIAARTSLGDFCRQRRDEQAGFADTVARLTSLAREVPHHG